MYSNMNIQFSTNRKKSRKTILYEYKWDIIDFDYNIGDKC